MAELYDRARPSYPSALVDDVLEFAGVGRGDHALEVGAGTGKATVLFAARGLAITALEPSSAMAALARRNCARYANVSIVESEFEHWSPAQRGGFRLLFSAQAWHWVSPEVAYTRAREVLTDGGALAVFWNRPRWESCPLRAELAEAYRRTVPDPAVMPGPMHPALGTAPDEWEKWRQELEAAAGFAHPEVRTYRWTEQHRIESYLLLLRTHSDHIVLPDSQRERLLEAVGDVISRNGGILPLEYETSLCLARASRGDRTKERR